MSTQFPPTGLPPKNSYHGNIDEDKKKLAKDKDSFIPIPVDLRIKEVSLTIILTNETQEPSSPKSDEGELTFPHFKASYSHLRISPNSLSSGSQTPSSASSNASTPKESPRLDSMAEPIELIEFNLEQLTFAEESNPALPKSAESARVAQIILNKNLYDSEAFVKDNPMMEVSEFNWETVSIKTVPEPEINPYTVNKEDQIDLKEEASSSPFTMPAPNAITPQPNIEYGHIAQEQEFIIEDSPLLETLGSTPQRSKEDQSKEAEMFKKAEHLTPQKTIQKTLHSTVNSGIVDKMAKYLAFKQGLESPPKTNLELFELYKKSGKTSSQVTVKMVKQNLIDKIFNKPINNWPENLKALYRDIERSRAA